MLPTASELARARNEVKRLSNAELAGQLVVAQYSGNDPEDAARLVRRYHLAGVIVMGDNVPPAEGRAEALRDTAAAVRKALRDDGRSWPAVIGVDQEGGPVVRVYSPTASFPSPMAMGAVGSVSLARATGRASGSELAALGFTMVYAPVVDVTAGRRDPTIGVRSLGSSPQRVAEISVGLSHGYRDAGIIPVAKHFPGHGSLTTDSHVGLPVQDRTLEQMMKSDLVPFVAQVKAGTPAIMVGHILAPEVDPRHAATVSGAWVKGVLRTKLGFRGIVITDALNMGAITSKYGASEAVVRSVRSGVDLVLMPTSTPGAVSALRRALDNGSLSRRQAEESAARVVATMRRADTVRRAASPVTQKEARAVAREVALKAVTQVSGPCDKRLVGTSITIVGGTARDRRVLTEKARAAGLTVGRSGTRVVLLGGQTYYAGGGGEAPSSVRSGDVVVALDVPYALAGAKAKVKLATFGRTYASFTALVRVLLGARAPGKLPVRVGTAPLGTGCPVPKSAAKK